MSGWELTWCVKVVLACPLRTAQDVWELVDVFNSVFEGLYLGQGLPPLAVVRRQVVAELVQSLRKTPHPHLLPLAGLHAPFGGHLGLAHPLRCRSRPASREADGQIADVLVPAGEAHLRRRAAGVHGGLRRGGLKRVPILTQATPLRQYSRRDSVQVHVRNIPRLPDVRAARMTSGGFCVGGFFFAKEVLYRSRSPGVYGFTAPAGKKKKKSSKKTSSAKMRPSRRTSFVITGVWIRLNRRIMWWKEK